MRASPSSRGPFCERRIAVFFAFLFVFFSATVARAQDVAETAKQERARKAAHQESPRHVYTEEELQRKNILTPEDQARVEARRHQPGKPPAEQSAASHPIDADTNAESLGEIARRYRQEKEARAAEQSAKKNFTPFLFKIPAATLAAPKPEVARKPDPSPLLNSRVRTLASPLPNSHRSLSRTGEPTRISPFQPRPLIAAPRALPDSLTKPFASPDIARRTPPVSPTVESRPPANRLALQPVGLRSLQVQRGESWWKLAERYLGSGAKWPELRKLNPGINGPPESLLLGITVLVPEKTSVRYGPSSITIIVKKGDSLWALAREHLGRASEWPRLARANPQVSDYTHLAIGASLRLPAPDAPSFAQSATSAKHQQ